MYKIKEALAIIKTRWLEVCFIVFLIQTSLLLPPLITHSNENGIGFLTFLLLHPILIAGWQKSIMIGINKPENPFKLFQLGWHYYGRLLLYFILYIILYVLSFTVFVSIITRIFSLDSTADFAKNSLMSYLFFIFASVILVKLIFIYPIIIQLDCRLIKSLKYLKFCKLKKAKNVLLVYFLTLVFPIIPLAIKLFGSDDIWIYFINIPIYIITTILGLVLSVLTMWFVMSLKLVYDKPVEINVNKNGLLETHL